jgi:hypothetical protein
MTRSNLQEPRVPEFIENHCNFALHVVNNAVKNIDWFIHRRRKMQDLPAKSRKLSLLHHTELAMQALLWIQNEQQSNAIDFRQVAEGMDMDEEEFRRRIFSQWEKPHTQSQWNRLQNITKQFADTPTEVLETNRRKRQHGKTRRSKINEPAN